MDCFFYGQCIQLKKFKISATATAFKILEQGDRMKFMIFMSRRDGRPISVVIDRVNPQDMFDKASHSVDRSGNRFFVNWVRSYIAITR